MLLWIAVSSILFAIVVFLFLSLRRTADQNVDYSIDAFIDHSGSDIPVADNTSLPESQYKRTYTCEGRQILIAFATEYGCSEQVARTTYDKILASSTKNHGNQWQPRIINLKYYDKIDFTKESVIIFICSTAGDGVPPTEARPFFEYMNNGLAFLRTMLCVHFAVMALGDSNYPHFCRAGQQLDQRLHEIGWSCLLERVDINQEDWNIINTWLDMLVERLGDIRDNINVCMDYLGPILLKEEDELGFHRARPFMATVTNKHMLTVVESPNDRETVHIDFDLTGSNLDYSAGDALGVWPKNNPSEVRSLLIAMNCSGLEQVEYPSWAYFPRPQDGQLIELKEALLLYYDLKTVQLSLLKLLKENVQKKNQLTDSERHFEKDIGKGNASLQQYVAEREVVDILEDFRTNSCSWKAILQHLKPLQPRYYSIASSPKLNHDIASVCVAVVRYSTLTKIRTGVATTFMQDQLTVGDQCPVFISHNPDFRLPSETSRPIVMIGAGTGLAPFRAFIQERCKIFKSWYPSSWFCCFSD
jgi:sulfite reductase (NADPH) flavoprotein alpha-component